jgi:hypothetical protein
MSSAGKFSIDVIDPYPVHCTLYYGGIQIARFSHLELRDLQYTVERAITEARMNLKNDRDEV